MRYSIASGLLLSMLLIQIASAQTIPSDRLVDWSIAGYDGRIPQPEDILDITDFGAIPDDGIDDGAAISAAITDLGGRKGVVYLPAGTFLGTATISLPSNVVIRGESSDSTVLQFDLGDAAVNGFSISGGSFGSFVGISSGALKDSKIISVADGSAFHVGNYAEIRQANGSWDTNPADWAKFAVGQIVRINGVNGDELTLEHPLRIDYDPALNPEIRRFSPKRDVGIENLKLERIDNPGGAGYNIGFSFATQCWVKGVESNMSAGSHIMINASSHIEVTGCYIHDSFGYDGSGTRGYGITFNNHSGECLAEDNIFKHLRHAMMTKMGANGNVIAYNYSRENYRSETFSDLGGDISLHGHYSYANLFEGNIVQTIMVDHYWGPSGPLNTFFRNRTELYGLNFTNATGGTEQTERQNIVGNAITTDNYSFWFNVSYGSHYEPRGSGHFEYGNLVDTDIEPSGTGSLQDETYYLDQAANTCLLATAWPPFGIPNGLYDNTNRAKQRWESGGVKTVYDLIVDAGSDDSMQIGESTLLEGFSRGGYGPVDYQWSPATGLSDPSAFSTMASPEVTTVYSLVATDANGCTVSDEITVQVVGTVSDPVFDPEPGTYGSLRHISISSDTALSEIHYTTDGSAPDQSSAVYSSPIVLDSSLTIKARAYRDEWTPSRVVVANYVFDDENECSTGANECSEYATCTNTVGAYECSCNEGYEGDGFVCTSVCGDGIVVADEDCDPQNPSPSDCCTDDCLYESAQAICRAAMGSCDVAEYCSGDSDVCPEDVFVEAGTDCGDSTTECSNSDSCDGNGNCLTNDLDAGTPCGDLADECTNADACDGEGNCTDNGYASAGTVCGEPADICSDQDSCDGAGNCLANDYPEDTPCGDDNLCTTGDHCVSGLCVGDEMHCDDGIDCTVDSCIPENGACSFVPDDTLCVSDNECKVGVCDPELDCQLSDVDNWTQCGDDSEDGFACFSGICEEIAENDTCESATELMPGESVSADIGAYHHSLVVGPPCSDEEISGADAFYRFNAEAGIAYQALLTPSESADLALALWNGCPEEGECLDLSDVQVAGTEEGILIEPSEEAVEWILQVVDIAGGEQVDDGGFSLVVNETELPDGDMDDDRESEIDGDEDFESVDTTEADSEVTDGDIDEDIDEETIETEAAEEEMEGESSSDGDDTDGDDEEDENGGEDSDKGVEGEIAQGDGDAPDTPLDDDRGGSGGGCRSTDTPAGLMLLVFSAVFICRRKMRLKLPTKAQAVR